MAQLDARRQAMLAHMGVDLWRARADASTAVEFEPVESAPAATHPSAPVPAFVDAPLTAPPLRRDGPDPHTLDWPALEACVRDCQRCELARGRTQTVFGVGNRAARWLVIGEAPGAEEDRRGEPFVGRAGQLLNSMLRAIGLAREEVYIANILKCRPPNNRDPRPEEVIACRGYLERQIALIDPTLILAVGRISAQNLLSVDTPIGRLRGTLHSYGQRSIPVVVTYHPAYLLRSPGEKRKAWDDLRLALATFRSREGAAS
ncbi:MAG: uracil-DNA glycosylase [Gammaproteobacteria bacterium]|jgi:uracil-DNA glycosylase|nr:uracil-DNA glycosylase [Gammaproteobacteria bacterium]